MSVLNSTIVGLESHASVAVVFPNTTGVPQSTVSLTAHVMLGGVISCTAIVRLQVDELPQSSVAVHVRVTL